MALNREPAPCLDGPSRLLPAHQLDLTFSGRIVLIECVPLDDPRYLSLDGLGQPRHPDIEKLSPSKNVSSSLSKPASARTKRKRPFAP